jgi:ABC-2 type transport system ATP-binding protein
MTAQSSGAIETTALTKRYGGTVAVENLNIEIPGGSIYGFLGPNGAGKSTTMQMLTSLTEPTSGSGTIVGESITDRANLKSHIGYMPEEPSLYDELSGREQLDYIADLQGIPEAEANQSIEGYLDALVLKDDASKPISAYSKGMRQKTAFIQAVLHDPEVLFLDEPTSGLDPRAARTIHEEIERLSDDGMTVFLSTHILPVVDDLADRVGVLNNGRIVTEGPPEMLKREANRDDDGTLEDVFLNVTTERSAPRSISR